jgi:hypothetical protein
METKLANIIPDSKLNTKLLNNNANKINKNTRNQLRELDKSEENINKYKTNLNNKINNNTNTNNINYSKSNFLSKLFFIWARAALQKSNQQILTQEDVCKVSEQKSINYEINKIKNTFLKYNNSHKWKKYSLVITIILTNFKLLLFLLF